MRPWRQRRRTAVFFLNRLVGSVALKEISFATFANIGLKHETSPRRVQDRGGPTLGVPYTRFMAQIFCPHGMAMMEQLEDGRYCPNGQLRLISRSRGAPAQSRDRRAAAPRGSGSI